jgi:hypothetical protein
MTTESKAAFARRHGVNRSTVSKWEAKGHLVMTANGLVEVEQSEQRLTGRPAHYRGGTSKAQPARPKAQQDNPVSDPPAQPDPAEMALAALSFVVREIGVRVAARAVEFGAPLNVAYALDIAACLEAGDLGECFLTSIGALLPASTSLVEVADAEISGIADPDWPALAAAAGEPLDLDAIEDWFTRLPFPSRPVGATHV